MKEIKLSQGKVALVDDEDYEMLNKYKWYAHYKKSGDSFYARRTIKFTKGCGKIEMHRQIMNTPKGMHTDHINHDTLNNQKSNLRICSPSENARNRGSQSVQKKKKCASQYKGVCRSTQINKWQSQIQCNKKHIHIGTFTNEEDAARAYNDKATELFGEFAVLNEIGAIMTEKKRIYMKEYRLRPERIEKNMIKNWKQRGINITIEQYRELVREQNNKCAICGQTPEKQLCVDHNHTGGAIRKLLCHQCNLLLGCAHDDVEILKNAIQYLGE